MIGSTKDAHEDIEEEKDSQQWTYSIIVRTVQRVNNDLRIKQTKHKHRCRK